MLVIPFELKAGAKRGPLVVVLVLEKDNLDRMKEADPFDMHFSAYREHMDTSHRVRDLDFVIAYEEDTEQILKFRKEKDLAGLLTWLQRGRRIEKGDLHAPQPYRKN